MDPNNVEIIYVNDERNATARPAVIDQRAPIMVQRQPMGVQAIQPRPAVYPQQYAQPYPQQYQRPPVVIVQQPRRSSAMGLLSSIKAGSVIKNLAGMVAAVQPLPEPPVASGIDVADRVGVDMRNFAKYSYARDEHIKTDERLRTFASVLGDTVDWALANLTRS